MKNLTQIKGVFLDLGGTLLYPPSGSWTFSNLAYGYFPKEKLETPQAVQAMDQAHQKLCANHLLSSLEREYELFYDYYAAIAAALPELGLTEEDLQAVTRDKVYNKPDNYRLFDDTRSTLEALAGKYRLGIISDTWPSIVPVLEHFDILKYFDCVTYSFQLGVFKPDRRMYSDALEKMALPAGETLFVDDRDINLIGAREAGIHPVLIRAMPGIEPREDMDCIDRISQLGDLLEMEHSGK